MFAEQVFQRLEEFNVNMRIRRCLVLSNRVAARAALLAVMLSGCAVGPGSAQAAASPFPRDSSILGAVLDAVTIREAPGQVFISTRLVEDHDGQGLPYPVRYVDEPTSATAARIAVIRGMGLAVDSVVDIGDCPGYWNEIDRTALCPAVQRTTIAVSPPRSLSDAEITTAMLYTVHGPFRPSVAVRVLFVHAGPMGASLILEEYFCHRSGDGQWFVV
ncbi:MAG TPA: hypothetical protein PLL69_12825, partial [Gemmatimonadales bacterium]|nr:hypothetical protein [Gemmatimonadales bacterium]